MYDKKIVIYKKPGQTPLECVISIKKDHPEWAHLPMTYAGRLDPLAEGVLVILVGDECFKKDEYLALPKEYELSVLFGFATDTYDLMGKVTDEQIPPDDFSAFTEDVKEKLKNFIGRINQEYPVYSSRTVDGKPLYKWAREGRIGEIKIPSHDVFIKDIELLDTDSMSGFELNKKINEVVSLVKGDFRQEEILSLWNEILKNKQDDNYPTITIKVSCGSGVYVRSIAHELGKALGVPSVAFQIVRKKVGDYTAD
jgi:tRNA pseudouridine55 synthase